MQASATRHLRLRRILLGLLLVAILAGGVLALVFSRGVYATYPKAALRTAAQQRAAPAWTRPCWPTARQTDKATCARVVGRVVWIQKHDPDGDRDRHLIVIDRLHPRIVKLVRQMPVDPLPRIGSRIDAVGWLMRGGSGHTELDTQRIRWSGHVASFSNDS